jgi:hypothetical protein
MFAPLDELESAIDKLAASGYEPDLARLRRLVERLESEFVRRVRQADRAKDWAADDFISPAAWLRDQANLAPGHARATVALARRLDHFPKFAQAFASGDVSRQHVTVLTGAASPERLPALQALERELLEAAKVLDPQQFSQIVRHACDAIDGDGGAAETLEQYNERRLDISRTFGGMVKIDGLLPPVEGEALLTAIKSEARAEERRESGRTLTQLRADALMKIVYGKSIPRPRIIVTADLAELEARAPGISKTIRSDLAHGGRISRATLERLACDADISRVITAGGSQPLDVGRTTRTPTPAIWRALVARDQHCQAPGCDRPPSWCQAHHIKPWPQGGETKLDNLILLCDRHHHAVHEGGKSPPMAA